MIDRLFPGSACNHSLVRSFFSDERKQIEVLPWPLPPETSGEKLALDSTMWQCANMRDLVFLCAAPVIDD